MDLSNANDYKYSLLFKCPEIIISKIEKAICKALPNKAPDIDGISNRTLQQTLHFLLPSLHKLYNTCLNQDYCSAHFKKSITIILQKPKKNDYSQPKIYKPIALFNTMNKAFKTIMAN
jgi:hypothetical protein